MKELSIEEKARRYDEAIKRAQAKIEEAKVFDYDDEQTSHTIRLTTTDIFPELKESEDGRIRKVILKALMADEAINILVKSGIYYESVESWLEKQGEQNPVWSEADEEKMNWIIATLNNCSMRNSESLPMNESCEDWLKSIKERYIWKPSEEQIQALEAIIGCVHDNSSWEISTEWLGVLLNLKEQLKKLREE